MRASCSAALFGIFVVFIFTITQPALGSIWDGGGVNSNWENRFNWTGDVAPANDGLSDIFMAGAVSLSPAVNVNYDIHSLVFDNNAGTFNIVGPSILTIRSGGIQNNSTSAQRVSAPIQLAANQRWISGATSAGTLDITGSINTNPYTINTSGAGQITLSGPIAGVGGFTLDGIGTVTFSGSSSNIFAGPTTLNAGTLELLKNAGTTAIAGPLIIGDGAGIDSVRVFHSDQIADNSPLTINSSGRLSLEGASDAIGSLTMNGAAAVTTSGTGTLSLRGPITAAGGTISGNLSLGSGAGALVVNNASLPTADLTISAAISGATGLTKSGNGILQFTGSAINTYSGDTAINAGTLVLNRSSTAGSISSGTITVGNGVNPANLTLAAANQLGHVSLVINNSATLNGSNVTNSNYLTGITMTGGAIVDANLEMISKITALASAKSATISGGSLLVRETNTPFDVADGAAADDLIVTAALTGTQGYDKLGAGTLRYAGSSTNTYTGTSNVKQGTLILNKPNSASAMNGPLVIGDNFSPPDAATVRLTNVSQVNNSSVTVAKSGFLDSTTSQTIKRLAINGGHVSIAPGTRLTSIGDLTTATYIGNAITGGGELEIDSNHLLINAPIDISATLMSGPSSVDLTKDGTNNLRINGAGSIVGHLTINEGSVLLASTAPGGAIVGDVQVGDGVGTSESLKLELNNQINGHDVVVRNNATLDLAGHNDSAGLEFNGGGTVSTGAGTLKLASINYNRFLPGSSTTNEGAMATLSGNFDFTDLQDIFIVDVPATSTEITIPGNIVAGRIIKNGDGGIRLGGNNNLSSVELNQGSITVASNTALGTAPVTLNGGTLQLNFGITLSNNITLNASANLSGGDATLNGALTGPGNLTKQGAGTITLTQPIALQNIWTIAGGGVSAANLTINNTGQITLANGTLSGPITNNGQISGYGTISTTTSFTNNGSLRMGAGSLTLAGSGTHTNNGVIDLISGRVLVLNSNLTNKGTINLNGSAITGTSTLFNLAGATIAGRATIFAPVNNDGTIALTDGTTGIVAPSTNTGTIELTSDATSLTGGKVSSSGTIHGLGYVGSDVDNTGTIEASGGMLNFSGAVNNSGRITASTGNKVLFSSGLASNPGLINLSGGTFDNNGHPLTNAGQITGFGTFRASELINNGAMTFFGGQSTIIGDISNSPGQKIEVENSPALFTGTITNSGIFKSTQGQITFSGKYIENGTFSSDPADNYFSDVTIGRSGAWVGGVGDRFFVSGDFHNQSTSTEWNTDQAELLLLAGGGDLLEVNGRDLGVSFEGYDDNYAWGTLALAAGRSLTLSDADATPGGAIYSGHLDLQGGISQIANITGNGLTLYYHLGNPENAYLGGKTYQLAGGGSISPVPEPGTSLLTLALAVLAARPHRRARKWRRV